MSILDGILFGFGFTFGVALAMLTLALLAVRLWKHYSDKILED